MVVTAALGLIASQGQINVFAVGVFLKPISQDLGFGRLVSDSGEDDEDPIIQYRILTRGHL